MQIWLDVVDPCGQNFMDAFRHVIPPLLQTQQKPRVTEAQHNAEKHFLFAFAVNDFDAKKFVINNEVLFVTELIVGGTQCRLNER